MDNRQLTDDLWPRRGDYLRYIWPSCECFYFEGPKLNCDNEYCVVDVMFVTCGDHIQVQDDNDMLYWVPLHRFCFIDQRTTYGQGGNT